MSILMGKISELTKRDVHHVLDVKL